jgi:hypothetical protein
MRGMSQVDLFRQYQEEARRFLKFKKEHPFLLPSDENYSSIHEEFGLVAQAFKALHTDCEIVEIIDRAHIEASSGLKDMISQNRYLLCVNSDCRIAIKQTPYKPTLYFSYY